MRTGPVMTMEDIDTETRWPEYLPGAAAKGLKSQLALRLYTEAKTLGGLNLYSTKRRGIDPDAVGIAELFATHAALALDRARYDHDLSEAVASRQVIGTAVGIVMQRFEITENRAFQYLARASMSSNIKLRVIAEEVVTSTNERFAEMSAPGVS
jgi:GAF domain-containing protein